MINIIGNPQTKDTFFYDYNFNLQNTLVESQGSSWLALTVCPTRAGTVVVLYTNVATFQSKFVEYSLATQTVLRTVIVTPTYGSYSGRHCLLERANGNFITIDNATYSVVELSKVDFSVVHTYGLNLSGSQFLDGAVNFAGNLLAYANGNYISFWDLNADSAGPADLTNTNSPTMVCWLLNDTIIYYTGAFRGSGYAQRVDLTDTILNSYPAVTFSGSGVLGIAASVKNNTLYIYGCNNYSAGDVFAYEQYDLTVGTFLKSGDINGPISSSWPYSNYAAAFAIAFEPTILYASINCANTQVTLIGDLFPANPTINVTYNGMPYTNWTLISNTSTQIIIQINNFQNGNWQFAVN